VLWGAWARQNLREQVGLLEVLFLVLYDAQPASPTLVETMAATFAVRARGPVRVARTRGGLPRAKRVALRAASLSASTLAAPRRPPSCRWTAGARSWSRLCTT